MELHKHIQKAMIDKDIKGPKQLSELSGISYEKTLRLLKGNTSIKLKDAMDTARALGLELKFISTGE